MTAASRGPDLLSIFSERNDLFYRTRREPFLFSVLGQAAIVVIIMYSAVASSCIPPLGFTRSRTSVTVFSFLPVTTAVVAEASML